MRESRFRHDDRFASVLTGIGAAHDTQVYVAAIVVDDDNLTVVTVIRWPNARYQRWTRIVLDSTDSIPRSRPRRQRDRGQAPHGRAAGRAGIVLDGELVA